MIENTRCLQNFLNKRKLSDEEKKLVKEMINAFSEYIVAVDTEFKYNKSFLPEFSESFITSVEHLSYKKKFMEEKILNPLEDYLNEIIVVVDDAWVYEKRKIVLTNEFNAKVVNSDKIRYQIKHIKEPQFSIAREIKISEMDEVLKEDIERFLNRTVEKKNEV